MAYFTNAIFYVDNTPTDRLWTCVVGVPIPRRAARARLATQAATRKPLTVSNRLVLVKVDERAADRVTDRPTTRVRGR